MGELRTSPAKLWDSWTTRAMQALHRLTIERRFLTSDELHEVMGDDRPRHHNQWGAVMNDAQTLGWIVPTGRYVQSRRSPAKSRTIKVFQSAYDRAKSSDAFEDPVEAYQAERAEKARDAVQEAMI